MRRSRQRCRCRSRRRGPAISRGGSQSEQRTGAAERDGARAADRPIRRGRPFRCVPDGRRACRKLRGRSRIRRPAELEERGHRARERRGRAEFSLGSTPEALGVEEVTVTGYRLAQITALQDKKASQTIKESVTADDAGKLPDQNAGETLARVTGVAVTTDQGEGRYVTIRGIDAALSNVTIDGQIIGSPEGDTRRVAIDTVPANILSKLEVVKAATPDLDGNAIGGTINLVTPSVFDDPDGRFFAASADFGYYDLGGQNPWGGSIGWGNIFNDRFGILLSASYSDREFNSHNVQGGDPWEEEGDFLIPDEM